MRVAPTGERGEALYDLAADPGETRDAHAEHPQEARRLAAALAAHQRGNLNRARDLVATVLDGHLRDLRSLPPGARAERTAEICDELAMLRYVYEVENPSLFRAWRGRGNLRRTLRSRSGRRAGSGQGCPQRLHLGFQRANPLL